jgi:hypothetical protein
MKTVYIRKDEWYPYFYIRELDNMYMQNYDIKFEMDKETYEELLKIQREVDQLQLRLKNFYELHGKENG